jgi:hypothetical protein
MSQKAVSTQDVTNAVSLPVFYCMQNISLLLDSMQYFLILYTISPSDHHSSPAPHFKSNQLTKSAWSLNNIQTVLQM